jgi:hypothetical protein
MSIGGFPPVALGQSRPASAPEVRIVRIDGTQQQAEWLGADAEGVQVRLNGASSRIARDDLMLVAFSGQGGASRTAVVEPGEALCVLADGGTIRGERLESDDGHIRIRTALVGDLTFAFAQLAAIRLGSVDENPKAQGELDTWLTKRPAGNDVLIAIRDGNVTAVRGALVALGPGGGKFLFGGKTLPLRADVAYGVVFGAGLSAPPAAPFTVTLRDGTTLVAGITKADASTVSLELAGHSPVAVPISQVEAIAVRSPRVTFASDLTPSEVIFEPFLDTPWPHRRDRAVSNRPLRLGGVEYVKGLGVHSRSELVFDVEGRYKQFAATIGIDDYVRPRGNVVFRIVADDREVFKSGPVTGKDDPRPVLADITRAKRVRLIVEYGGQLDLADHADWANARFLR